MSTPRRIQGFNGLRRPHLPLRLWLRLPASLHQGLRRIGLPLALLLAVYLVLPLVTLWRLDRATLQGPDSALDRFVDIEAVRLEILRRLNKDAHSHIGEVSDQFVDWIIQAVRQPGNQQLERSVTLPWLRVLLLSRASSDGGFLTRISQIGFDSPTGLHVRIGAADNQPLHLRLQPTWRGWQVTAVHY
ncbi:MAG: DUF2939 domain-containing protein [Chromatiaceae bacterium]|nr:MAG: DUF2939 domain-containing protein [Chromatiaceae bacterium]